jgi:hypothetical protein
MSLLLLVAFAAAETVSLRFDPTAAAATAPMRCTGDREQRRGPQSATVHTDLRVTPELLKSGNSWAVGTRALEVIEVTQDPAPPPGAPSLDALLARVEPVMPRYLVDKKGRWKGVDAYDPGAIEAVFTGLLTEAGLPAGQIERMRPMLADSLGPEALALRLREDWYAHIGHWLGRELTVGRSELGEAGKKEPFPEGTALTWSASREVPCAEGGAPTCVELRLEARLPEATVREDTLAKMTATAQAAGIGLGEITFDSGSSITTWIAVVDPQTLAATRTSRRRVTDAQLSMRGRHMGMGTVDVLACVVE